VSGKREGYGYKLKSMTCDSSGDDQNIGKGEVISISTNSRKHRQEGGCVDMATNLDP